VTALVSQLPTQEPANQSEDRLAEASAHKRSCGSRRAWLATGVGLLIVYSLPIAPFRGPIEYLLGALTSVSDISAWTIGRVEHQIVTVLLILAIIRFWERRPFSSAGFRRMSWADVSAAAFTWWNEYLAMFPTEPSVRQIMEIEVEHAMTSCGYAVPRDGVEERDTLRRYW
jgi:hypothetical protein